MREFIYKRTKPVEQRSSYGLGEVIIDALNNGADNIVISLGGIDSFDGGIGMMQALGAQFYNDEGELLDAREGAQGLNLFVELIFLQYLKISRMHIFN